MDKLTMVLSELEGETLIDANLLMENLPVREAIKQFIKNEINITEVIAVIDTQF